MKVISTFIAFVFLSVAAMAGASDHPMGKIVGGSHIDLSTLDHSIAGRIGDNLVYGTMNERGEKFSEITIKSPTKGTVDVRFAHSNGIWGGTIGEGDNALDVQFVRIDRSIPAYFVSFGGKEYKVRVESEGYANNHFIRPTYILEKDGEEISAHMTEGQACWMYSMHLIFMIFGSYFY